MIGLSGNHQPLKPAVPMGTKQLAQQPPTSTGPATNSSTSSIDLRNAHANDRTWLQTFAAVTSRYSDINRIQQEMSARGINVTPDQLTRISGLVNEELDRGDTGALGYRNGPFITPSDAVRFIGEFDRYSDGRPSPGNSSILEQFINLNIRNVSPESVSRGDLLGSVEDNPNVPGGITETPGRLMTDNQFLQEVSGEPLGENDPKNGVFRNF